MSLIFPIRKALGPVPKIAEKIPGVYLENNAFNSPSFRPHSTTGITQYNGQLNNLVTTGITQYNGQLNHLVSDLTPPLVLHSTMGN